MSTDIAWMEEAFEKAVPPWVACRSGFPNAMDRAWDNMGTMVVPRPADRVILYCGCRFYKTSHWNASDLTKAAVVATDFVAYRTFRSYFTGECPECHRLYCVRILEA